MFTSPEDLDKREPFFKMAPISRRIYLEDFTSDLKSVSEKTKEIYFVFELVMHVGETVKLNKKSIVIIVDFQLMCCFRGNAFPLGV